MSRFYFHLHECGTVCTDEEGFELAGLGEARTQAIAAARDVMSEEVLHGRLCLSCHIEIADSAGATLLVVPFRDALTLSGL